MENPKMPVEIKAQITSVINYAVQQNRIPVVQSVTISNNTNAPLENAVLKIWAEPGVFTPFERNIDFMPAENSFYVNDISLIIQTEYLAGLTERIEGYLHIELFSGEQLLSAELMNISVLAFDEWHGYNFFPELLISFVTPNHPEVIKINARASEILGKWTGNPSLNAYQTQNPNRVLQQAVAVYGALQEQNIVYAEPPASFEVTGQRVRLCDAVIQQRMGTCLDLTLFYASCLEAIGIRPLLIIKRGHIFLGFWLEDLSFPEAVQDDASLITKRLADGINEIAVVECTALTAGKTINFDEASKIAVSHLEGLDSIEYIIDVYRGRISGIRPLPLRIQSADGWKIEKEKRSEKELTAAPEKLGNTVAVTESAPEKATKKNQWERKLLDLGLRNTLINMRLSKTTVPILSSSLGELEDALSDGSEFGILPRPAEWNLQKENEVSFETLHNLKEMDELISSEFKNKRLRSAYNEAELSRNIINLYRSSKTSLEENGANTLYIAMGLLRWYETKASQKPRYAPIVLIPVEIVRKSAKKGYVVRLRDDEPQMNITLLEMLRQDFGITVSGLDPLPHDDHGVDIRKVFAVMRTAVMAQKGWDVLESAYLGIFSFSQFVMWNDIRNRSEDLEKNKIVKSLIDGKLAWNAEVMEIGKTVSEDSVLLPLPADASQLFAIESAEQGKSFVLHGPPGTGKSQTITALIANALAQGKTVLFVAEKMAALSVVQARLKKIGLAPFCLELHSNKSRKKDVLEQLKNAAETVKPGKSEEYLKKAQQISELRKELNDYASKLHEKRSCGLSLFELVNRYEANKNAPDKIRFTYDFVKELNYEKLEANRTIIERLIASAKAVGHPSGHPLRYIGKSEYSYQIKNEAINSLTDYKEALSELKDACREFCENTEAKDCNTYTEIEALTAYAKEMEFWNNVPRAWARAENISNYLFSIRDMANHYISADSQKNIILQSWKPEFLQQNGSELKTKWESSSSKWFLSKMIETGGFTKNLSSYARTAVNKNDIPIHLNRLLSYQQEKALADEIFSKYGSDLEALYDGENTNWKNIIDLAEAAGKSASRLEALTGSHSLRIKYCGEKQIFPVTKKLLNSWENLNRKKEALYQLFGIKNADTSDFINRELTMCTDIENHLNELKEWIVWQSISVEAENNGLEPVVSAYIEGINHEDVIPAYHKALYRTITEEIIDSDLTLNRFSGSVFNEKIQQFKKIDDELIELAKKEIFFRLASRIPDFTKEASQSSELGILQRAIHSGGRGISIRNLFEQIPNLLPRLCPCMLMSPISAAQYLNPKREPFDIVVFDEASQLPTCKAVGALARGKNAIIVGDPKQMPPTSFFSDNSVDEENLDIEDLESILDDCLALNIPQTRLLWHYRSRHESLIAFSNSQFYENKLYTFPSVNDRESKVRLIPVEGYFDRGKTRQNIAEAEAIVEEIKRRFLNDNLKNQSIGVVTFNISQQNLIDDLLSEAYAESPELEAWAFGGNEPLFIKNLENVQGDERDVILFSIGYGPDKDGKVYMNFGPLNRDGGWRRLNVAVSRARYEMVVFSTLKPEQINLSRTSSEGVRALKAFLEYAQGNSLSVTDSSSGQWQKYKNDIAVSISSRLKDEGYGTELLVGQSEYRIDIGVIDPENPHRYILGILLDGAGYGNAKTVRDREISQIEVLNGLGWNILRIWTMDWWDNSQREINRILDKINDIKENANTEQGKAEEKDEVSSALAPKNAENPQKLSYEAVKKEKAKDKAKEKVSKYKSAVLPLMNISPEEYILPQNTQLIRNMITEILKAEAPITEARLLRKIHQGFGISRSGSRVQSRTISIIELMEIKRTEYNGQTVYWRSEQKPLEYSEFRVSGSDEEKRDAKEIPVQETANAVYKVLSEQIGLPKDDLIRESAKLLGYTRLGGNVISAMESGISYAQKQGRIKLHENGNMILS